MKARLILSGLFLMVFCFVSAQTSPEPASKVMDKAYKQAAAEKKNVFLIFHASWCGWCKKLEASINDSTCKSFFDRSYVICELTVLENGDKKSLENPGAIELYNKYGAAGSGLPYFVFLDSRGKLLADSKMKYAGKADSAPSNMGCPAQDEEVAAFLAILKKTSDISDNEAKAVTERFRKNSAKSTGNH